MIDCSNKAGGECGMRHIMRVVTYIVFQAVKTVEVMFDRSKMICQSISIKVAYLSNGTRLS